MLPSGQGLLLTVAYPIVMGRSYLDDLQRGRPFSDCAERQHMDAGRSARDRWRLVAVVDCACLMLVKAQGESR